MGHGFICSVTQLRVLLHTTDVVSLDFWKAFDSVPHEHLSSKLQAHGIRDPLLSWVRNFLANCHQHVVLGGHYSSWTRLLCEVLQRTTIKTNTIPYLYKWHNLEKIISMRIICSWNESLEGTKECSQRQSNITGRSEYTRAMEQWMAAKP